MKNANYFYRVLVSKVMDAIWKSLDKMYSDIFIPFLE